MLGCFWLMCLCSGMPAQAASGCVGWEVACQKISRPDITLLATARWEGNDSGTSPIGWQSPAGGSQMYFLR